LRKGKYVVAFFLGESCMNMARLLIHTLIQFLIKIGSLGPVLGFSVVGPAIGAVAIAASSHHWLPYMRGLDHWGPYAFIAASVLLCGLSFIPTHASSLVAGMLFGSFLGSSLALLGIGGALLLGYIVFGHIVGEGPLAELRKNSKVDQAYRRILGSGFRRTLTLVILMRLSPIMPFAATNALMASVKVNLGAFITGSLVGLAPRVILVACLGATLSELDLSKAGHWGWLILGCAATLSLIWMLKRWLTGAEA
jgi:uncharacterized membrane protein YdjX (TVP38/TMEM64 family)